MCLTLYWGLETNKAVQKEYENAISLSLPSKSETKKSEVTNCYNRE